LVDSVDSQISVNYTLGTHGEWIDRKQMLEKEMRDRRGSRGLLAVNKARKRVKCGCHCVTEH